MKNTLKALAIYAVPQALTGQVAATLTLLGILKNEGWVIRRLHPPALERASKYPLFAKFRYLCKLLFTWFRSPFMAFTRPDFIYLNTGQSKISLIRDLIPFRILCVLTRAPAVVSLHGSVFMSWNNDIPAFKLFWALVKTADAVTVLGQSQQQKLISLGIPSEKVVILPNTCDLSPVQENDMVAKFSSTEPFHILFLSNLIDSKGYPAFLEAMELLSHQTDLKVKITLCGKLLQSDFGARFSSREEAAAWIESILNRIRQNPSFTIEWVHGAYGSEKKDLFRSAHLFIFPSQYAVEAQPIVLLEAMASGTAIITSKVGEIPETVANAAVLLETVTPEEIARQTLALLQSPSSLSTLAHNGLDLFTRRYSREIHKKMWLDLFEKIST